MPMWEKKKKKKKGRKEKRGSLKTGPTDTLIDVAYIYNKIHNERIIWKTLNEESSELKIGIES